MSFARTGEGRSRAVLSLLLVRLLAELLTVTWPRVDTGVGRELLLSGSLLSLALLLWVGTELWGRVLAARRWNRIGPCAVGVLLEAGRLGVALHEAWNAEQALWWIEPVLGAGSLAGLLLATGPWLSPITAIAAPATPRLRQDRGLRLLRGGLLLLLAACVLGDVVLAALHGLNPTAIAQAVSVARALAVVIADLLLLAGLLDLLAAGLPPTEDRHPFGGPLHLALVLCAGAMLADLWHLGGRLAWAALPPFASHSVLVRQGLLRGTAQILGLLALLALLTGLGRSSRHQGVAGRLRRLRRLCGVTLSLVLALQVPQMGWLQVPGWWLLGAAVVSAPLAGVTVLLVARLLGQMAQTIPCPSRP